MVRFRTDTAGEFTALAKLADTRIFILRQWFSLYCSGDSTIKTLPRIPRSLPLFCSVLLDQPLYLALKDCRNFQLLYVCSSPSSFQGRGRQGAGESAYACTIRDVH